VPSAMALHFIVIRLRYGKPRRPRQSASANGSPWPNLPASRRARY